MTSRRHTSTCNRMTTPLVKKTCNVGIARCSAACNEKCCDENCAAKYPGPMEGYGMCHQFIAFASDISIVRDISL
ncbi:hypothetical protein BDE02_18G071900 [Populus trichocarpa]|nr:hypothetical protein BDE02_18G071900 [Populus trichocarpa]